MNDIDKIKVWKLVNDWRESKNNNVSSVEMLAFLDGMQAMQALCHQEERFRVLARLDPARNMIGSPLTQTR